MAGESPDRSKQRESSVEPTSGKAGPVPETRDPRLPASRESDERGGVDTATRVLSTRDLTSDAKAPAQQDDTRLREAVAAWVRSGDEETETSDGKTAGTDEAAEAKTAGPNAAGTNPSEAKADNAEDAGAETSGAKTATAKAARAEDAGVKADQADASEAKTTGTNASEAQAARAEDASAKADEAEDAEAKADDAKAARADDAGVKADEAKADEADDAGAETAGAKTAAAKTVGTEDADTKADQADASEAKATGTNASEAKATGAKTAGARATEAKAAPAEDTEAKASVAETAGAMAATAKAAGAEDAGMKADGAKGSEAGGGDVDEAARAAGGGAASQADAGKDSEADADAEADVTDEREDAVAESDGPANAKDSETVSSDSDSDADADEPTAPESEADSEPADSEPADADGDSAPKGPPAPDDESRTGGAGGNTKGEGEAEATPAKPAAAERAGGNTKAEGEAEAKPVDQPTAVFKTPRQVDQPTTMLKLGGGKPKPPEADPERTSKFVALKPLDDPSTRKPPAGEKAATTATPPPADATASVPQIGPERTTQQPLPPKPPLDLLAELTNTPPPPETPVRTIVRRVKIWTPLVLLLVVVFAVVQAMRPLPTPTLALSAAETYTFDGRTSLPWPGEGQGWMDVAGIGKMGDFGKQTPVAIGSVAKTMTAYIILQEHPLKPGAEGPSITVDATAEKEGGYNKAGESTLDTVKEGNKLTEKQALSAVMIPSANNIARLLARWDAGSEAAFVKKMNATAKKLGMTHTTYTDPSGLKETTVSTAEDQVKLGNKVVKIPALTAITSAASWDDPTGKNWPNPNTLPYVMGAIGIKTGSTTAAGGNLLFAARKEVGGETVTVVGAILGQHKPDILNTVNTVSKTALVAAKDALTSAKILKKGDVVGYVDDGLGGRTPIVVTQDVTAVGWAGLKAKLSFDAGEVPHTAKAGTKVGSLTVGDGKSGAVKVPVALQKDLTEPGLGSKLTRLG